MDEPPTTLTPGELQCLLAHYASAVTQYNSARSQLNTAEEKALQRITGTAARAESTQDTDTDTDTQRRSAADAWAAVVLYELFLGTLHTHTHPMPLTQFVMARQFPTAYDLVQAMQLAAEAGLTSDENTKTGWVAVVYDTVKDRLRVGFIPNNELHRILPYTPLAVG